MALSTQTLRQKAYHEMKEFFLIALYLWVVFGLFVLYKSVLLAEENVTFVFQGFALINALAFGKVILIARAFHLGEGFDEAPLIYPTLLKSALFTILLACCKILEEAAVGHFRGKTLHESLTDLGGGTLRGMLTLSVLMFVMLIPFFAIGELQRVLGEGKLSQLFFRARLPTEEPKRES